MSNIRMDAMDGPGDGYGVICRAAGEEDVSAGLQLILATSGRSAGAAQVTDFLRFAALRSIDTSSMWIAEADGQILWAILPVVSAGHTMLLFAPTFIANDKQHSAAEMLTQDVLGRYAREGVQLAQVLLEPGDSAIVDFYKSISFHMMAELIYLQSAPRRTAMRPLLPVGFHWQTYSEQTHGQFAATIAASYDNSLDCPALNGLRDMEDVIDGHKAAGQFDAKQWFLLSKDESPQGVLLLTRTAGTDAMELAYLGLTPEARGQDLGNLLMREALAVTRNERCSRLTLAVDSLNAPALKLYYRHGFKRIADKLALMRDLRSTIHPQSAMAL